MIRKEQLTLTLVLVLVHITNGIYELSFEFHDDYLFLFAHFRYYTVGIDPAVLMGFRHLKNPHHVKLLWRIVALTGKVILYVVFANERFYEHFDKFGVKILGELRV